MVKFLLDLIVKNTQTLRKHSVSWLRLINKFLFTKVEDFCSFRNSLVVSYLGISMYIKYLSVAKMHPQAATVIASLSVCDALIFGFYLHTRKKDQETGNANHKSEFPDKEQ